MPVTTAPCPPYLRRWCKRALKAIRPNLGLKMAVDPTCTPLASMPQALLQNTLCCSVSYCPFAPPGLTGKEEEKTTLAVTAWTHRWQKPRIIFDLYCTSAGEGRGRALHWSAGICWDWSVHALVGHAPPSYHPLT